MQTERHIRLFRNGANQALRIPRDMELPCSKASIHKEGNRLIIEPLNKKSLLETLIALQPLDEDFPVIEDPPVIDEQVF